jgi:hypothetical protein
MWSPGSAGLGLAVLISAFAITAPSFSEENCSLRSGFFFEHRNGRQFAGLFRVALDPPDLRNPAAIKRHVVFAETWAHTITEEIFTRTGGACDAIIVNEGFPDLRAFLSVRRGAGQIDKERVVCAHLLQDVLNHFEPDEGQIKRAVERDMSFSHPIQPTAGTNAVELGDDVWNISQAALRLVYKKDSILHALTAISAGPPASVDVAGCLDSKPEITLVSAAGADTVLFTAARRSGVVLRHPAGAAGFRHFAGRRDQSVTGWERTDSTGPLEPHGHGRRSRRTADCEDAF